MLNISTDQLHNYAVVMFYFYFSHYNYDYLFFHCSYNQINYPNDSLYEFNVMATTSNTRWLSKSIIIPVSIGDDLIEFHNGYTAGTIICAIWLEAEGNDERLLN